jgi:hypothetical protein
MLELWANTSAMKVESVRDHAIHFMPFAARKIGGITNRVHAKHGMLERKFVLAQKGLQRVNVATCNLTGRSGSSPIVQVGMQDSPVVIHRPDWRAVLPNDFLPQKIAAAKVTVHVRQVGFVILQVSRTGPVREARLSIAVPGVGFGPHDEGNDFGCHFKTGFHARFPHSRFRNMR